MANPSVKSPLGRGLSALFGDADTSYLGHEVARQPKLVPIAFLSAGKYQPRQEFDDEAINGLAASIKEKGILQPILVRRHPSNPDAFEIIAGERRWRAAQKAGLHDVPVIVRELNDEETLEIALIENVQRQDLNPLEEAEAYKRLMDEFMHTQEMLAKAVGKSRSHIADMMRLLSLPESVKVMMRKGELTMGHARALLSVENPEQVAKDIVLKGLNVRAIEGMNKQKAAKKPANISVPLDADTLALQKEVSSWLGLAVQINQGKNGKGDLVISYGSLDQLEDVLKRLSTPAKK